MKMSEKRRQAVYNAISEPIVDLRIESSLADVNRKRITPKDMDSKLFALEFKIASRVWRALNLEDS